MCGVVSMLGMYFSVQLDLQTGATIVWTFGLVLIVMAITRPFVVSRRAMS
jgi:ABC-type Mn2+/Zn2+ transport system permease subunit